LNGYGDNGEIKSVVFLQFHVLYLFCVTCRLWLRLHWSQKRHNTTVWTDSR